MCLTGLLAGCVLIDGEPNMPTVGNGTDETVRLVIERKGVTTPLTTIASGMTGDLVAFDRTCTDGSLIALSVDGREIARRDEPLCPEENWLIERE
jgi:hypothetical protein